MDAAVSLKQAERKVFTTATQDGLTDIFIGCFLSMFAIAPHLSESLGDFWASAVFLPVWAVLMFAIWLVRRHVVKPRIGSVEFGRQRKTRLRRFSVLMLILNCLALAGGTWASLNADILPGGVPTVVFGILCLVFLSTAAYFLEFSRLYVYGLLIGIAAPVGEWLYQNHGASHHGFPIVFGIMSAGIVITGVIVFVRLLKHNPRPVFDPTAPEDQ